MGIDSADFGLGFLGSEKRVDLGNKLVGIGAVNGASLGNGFAARRGAAQTVHADLKEETCGVDIKIKNIADDGILGYDHYFYPPFFFFNLL